MLKRIVIYIFIFAIILAEIQQAQAVPTILSESAVLIDFDTGTILFEKNSGKRMYPASLTKIMTAIIALEKGKLTDIITVDEDTPYEIYGSHIALESGEILTLKDLLYALMLPSANDAASVIAKHYGGSIEGFAKLMNDKAKELGAIDTNFVNPHGLHEKNHYTTANDLAIITRCAMQNDNFKEIVKTTRYEIKPTNKKDEIRYFANLNKLIHNTNSNQIYVDNRYISPLYEGADGVKTGYTPEAGNCLVSSAQKGQTRLIMVSMNGISLEMYQDAHNLFNYGFNEYTSTTLIYKNTFVQNIKIVNGDNKEVSLITENDFTTLTTKEVINNIKSKVIIDDFVLPLEKNSVVGKIEYSLDGKLLGSVNLITPIGVNSTLTDASKKSIILSTFKSMAVLVFILTIFLMLFRFYNNIKIKVNRKKRRKKYYN
jgi:D-alanyl-D-alanine carboxypeptidase (penicillin-binding protein 5/6)